MGDDLEKLAAKGQQASADREAGASARQQSREDYRRYLSEEIVAHAFRDVHGSRLLAIAVVGGFLAVAVFIVLAGDVAAQGLVIVVLTVVGLGAGFAFDRYARQRAVRAGLAWIEGLPFELDTAAYLDGLSKPRMNTTVSLELRFADSPSEADRKLFSDACAGAVEMEDRVWQGRKLTLRSGPISSYFAGSGENAQSLYSNALVHRWMTRLVDQAVRAIHARQPIARATVKLE